MAKWDLSKLENSASVGAHIDDDSSTPPDPQFKIQKRGQQKMTNILDELDEVLAQLKRCVDRNRNIVKHEEKDKEIEPYISRSRTFNFSKGRSGSS